MKTVRYKADRGYYLDGVDSIIDTTLSAEELDIVLGQSYRIDFNFEFDSDIGIEYIPIEINRELEIVSEYIESINIHYNTVDIVMITASYMGTTLEISLYDIKSSIHIHKLGNTEGIGKLSKEDITEIIKYDIMELEEYGSDESNWDYYIYLKHNNKVKRLTQDKYDKIYRY